MRTIVQAIKQDLKQYAVTIRLWKLHRKTTIQHPPLTPEQQASFKAGYHDSFRARHLHVVYCLLRGRTIEQIEPKVRLGNELSERQLAATWLQWVGLPYPQRPEVADEAPLRARA